MNILSGFAKWKLLWQGTQNCWLWSSFYCFIKKPIKCRNLAWELFYYFFFFFCVSGAAWSAILREHEALWRTGTLDFFFSLSNTVGSSWVLERCSDSRAGRGKCGEEEDWGETRVDRLGESGENGGREGGESACQQTWRPLLPGVHDSFSRLIFLFSCR